ncbi:uncharacterized protein MYCFIDRAFT_171482 [Pseudocercospora fijiensis CIRAD86]|uniref:Uncharacterized protein n=1 Tax=Pseudocercospora fijiensis (strain CIRAD86) TaxID=383855 RepID=M3B8D7_PSEFD|nr:uncharacterized protein MYCFIDRAFT_171482 [Pseudocercospora fijiensis CIRAD86]EME85578.1 hypothetical protein MYCFIDRAFT_171482 [Pseudocercospora fijiensis CIRAD86]
MHANLATPRDISTRFHALLSLHTHRHFLELSGKYYHACKTLTIERSDTISALYQVSNRATGKLTLDELANYRYTNWLNHRNQIILRERPVLQSSLDWQGKWIRQDKNLSTPWTLWGSALNIWIEAHSCFRLLARDEKIRDLLDLDRLGLQILIQTFKTTLTTIPRLLHTTEWSVRSREVPVIDRNGSDHETAVEFNHLPKISLTASGCSYSTQWPASSGSIPRLVPGK